MKKIFALCLLPLLTACSSEIPSPTSIPEDVPSNKAHVILLAGGDNCLGYSYSYHLQEPGGVNETKFKEYIVGYDQVKISYKNMLKSSLVHKEQLEFVNTKLGQGKASVEGIKYGCLGPEVGLAEYLANASNDTYYIIKFAGAGESSFTYQWNVDSGVYYKKMSDFYSAQLSKLESLGIDFDIQAFLFVQGETDTRDNNPNYEHSFTKFVNQIKLDYHDYAPENGMSFIDAGVSSYYSLNYRRINAIKKSVMDNDSRNLFIDTISGDITRNEDNMDRTHYDAMGEIKLGHLFAKGLMNLANSKTTFDNPYCFETNNEISTFKSGYTISSINDGKISKAYYSFENNKISVDVSDEMINKNDGIFVKYVEASSDKNISLKNLKASKLYVNGDKKSYSYSESDHTLKEVETNNEEFVINGLTTKDKTIGYHIDLNIARTTTDKLYVSFGLINSLNDKENIVYYDGFKLNQNEVKTYLEVTSNGLIQNSNTRNGEFFGSVSNLEKTNSWDLSLDNNIDKRISTKNGLALNNVFAYRIDSNVLSFYIDITANGVINYDLYPKFGIILVDEEGNGLFYYVDAAGNGYSMEGVDLGYCLVSGGAFSTYTSLSYSVGINSSVYQDGNHIEMGVVRNQDKYSFMCNGEVVSTISNAAKIGLKNAYYGINTFNVAVTVSNYRHVL